MNLEKSKKRIIKKAKMGFQGYPTLTITYYGFDSTQATEVAIEFVAEESAEGQIETFKTQHDVREDEAIQSAIVKMIERSGAKSVTLNDGVSLLP